MASASGLKGMPNYSDYGSARGAQLAYVQDVGTEVAPHNVHINAIAQTLWKTQHTSRRAIRRPWNSRSGSRARRWVDWLMGGNRRRWICSSPVMRVISSSVRSSYSRAAG
jgi:NAD(P)-dependent dehydrogenase (short-subunit alcohol dehydrogenase family)